MRICRAKQSEFQKAVEKYAETLKPGTRVWSIGFGYGTVLDHDHKCAWNNTQKWHTLVHKNIYCNLDDLEKQSITGFYVAVAFDEGPEIWHGWCQYMNVVEDETVQS